MTLGTQRPDTKLEVILGVDTHLEFHTAVAVDHLLGREKPGRVEPTNDRRKWLGEASLCWAEGFGPVRCAGIEGTRAATEP